jgi:hypothetical protein
VRDHPRPDGSRMSLPGRGGGHTVMTGGCVTADYVTVLRRYPYRRGACARAGNSADAPRLPLAQQVVDLPGHLEVLAGPDDEGADASGLGTDHTLGDPGIAVSVELDAQMRQGTAEVSADLH